MEPDGNLTGDQQEFRLTMRRFFQENWSSSDVRRLASSTWAGYDERMHERLSQLDCVAMTVPEEFGGPGAAWPFAVVLHEEMGRALFTSPDAYCIGVSQVLLAAPTHPMAVDVLRSVTAGTAVVSYVDRPESGRPAEPLVASDDGQRIRGRSRVPFGHSVSGYVAVAEFRDGQSLFYVPAQTERVRVKALPTMAGPCLGDVAFADAEAIHLCHTADLPYGVAGVFSPARLLLAAEMLGGAESAMGLAVGYAGQRTAFGRRIGSFQAIQHKLADTALKIEAARAAIHYAARLVDRGSDIRAQVAVAVEAAKTAYRFAASNGVQVFGGAGVMDESDVSLHFRRRKILDLLSGPAQASADIATSAVFENPDDAIPPDVRMGAIEAVPASLPRPSSSLDPTALDQLRAEFRDFFGKLMTPQVRSEIRASRGDYSPTLYQAIAAQGYTGLAVPRELGGRGLGYAAVAAFQEEGMLAGLPHGVMSILASTVHFAAFMFIRLGTDEQRQHFLPRILSGEYRFTQGFTEPNCGSDLAAVECRAELVGDTLRLRGEKIFNSADVCTHMIAVVRTDATAEKHKGISLVVVDLSSPGVTISPINTMRGWRRNIVTFDDVSVAAGNLLGTLNNGWYDLMSNIDLERSGTRVPAERWRVLQQIIRLCSPGVAGHLPQQASQLLFSMYTYALLGWLLSKGVISRQERGEDVTSYSSFQKLFNGEAAEAFVEDATELLGIGSVIDGERDDLDDDLVVRLGLAALYQDCKVWQIAGGSSEIQRNIIAQRILRLPRK